METMRPGPSLPRGIFLPDADDPRWEPSSQTIFKCLRMADILVYDSGEINVGGIHYRCRRAKRYALAVCGEYAKRKALEAVES